MKTVVLVRDLTINVPRLLLLLSLNWNLLPTTNPCGFVDVNVVKELDVTAVDWTDGLTVRTYWSVVIPTSPVVLAIAIVFLDGTDVNLA